MRGTITRLGLALMLTLAAGTAGAQAPPPPTRDDIIGKLDHFDAAATIELAALKQQVLERARTRSRNDPGPVNRPPIAPELANLPTFSTPIQFDVDTPIIQPASYQTVGRIADALVQSSLLPYTFLIVSHVPSNGKREANVILSQRRADAIRDVLVNTFKISAKRIQAIGLGEEQLLDGAHPAAPANGQIQILTVAKIPEEQADRPAPVKSAAPAKKPARKR